MVAADFDVAGRHGRGASAKHDGFTRSFQKIARDFEGATLMISKSASNGVRVGAHAAFQTMEVAEVGIDHRSIG